MAKNAWGRHGRRDLQSSHTLSEPLARPAPEHSESEQASTAQPERAPEFPIPEAVVHERSPQRLPEDAFCCSPIAGEVIAVHVAAGDAVKRHQPVLIIEAMKMQNHIGAEVDGVVKAVHVAPGDKVKAGQTLFELG